MGHNYENHQTSLLFTGDVAPHPLLTQAGALTGQPLGTTPSAQVGRSQEDSLNVQNVSGLKLLWKIQVKNEPRSLAALTAPVVTDASHDPYRHPQRGLRGGKLR